MFLHSVVADTVELIVLGVAPLYSDGFAVVIECGVEVKNISKSKSLVSVA